MEKQKLVLVRYPVEAQAGYCALSEKALRDYYGSEREFEVEQAQIPTRFLWCDLQQAWVLDPVAPSTEIEVGATVIQSRSYPAADACDNPFVGVEGVVVSINDPLAINFFYQEVELSIPEDEPMTTVFYYSL